MFGLDEEGGDMTNYWIFRLMIAKEYQSQGYGCLAMQAAIERLKAKPDQTGIFTSYVLGNEVAAKLYTSLGFEKTGKIDDGEEVVQLKV